MIVSNPNNTAIIDATSPELCPYSGNDYLISLPISDSTLFYNCTLKNCREGTEINLDIPILVTKNLLIYIESAIVDTLSKNQNYLIIVDGSNGSDNFRIANIKTVPRN